MFFPRLISRQIAIVFSVLFQYTMSGLLCFKGGMFVTFLSHQISLSLSVQISSIRVLSWSMMALQIAFASLSCLTGKCNDQLNSGQQAIKWWTVSFSVLQSLLFAGFLLLFYFSQVFFISYCSHMVRLYSFLLDCEYKTFSM